MHKYPDIHLAQIVELRLRHSAADKLSHRTWGQVQDWLKSWTCINNFEAVLAPTKAQAIERCRVQIEQMLSCKHFEGMSPDFIEFQISEQVVKDGKLWLQSNTRSLHWFSMAD